MKKTADDPSVVNKSVREEFNKLQASYKLLEAAFNTLVAKLNLDAGVTDTDYATVTVTTADVVELTQ